MPEDDGSRTSVIEIHEEFVQHVEVGSSKMRSLSAVTIVVAAILVISYTSQLILPLTGTTSVTVNLADPTLIATEMAVMVLGLLWIFVGVRNYRFSARLAKQIVIARAAEAQIEKKITGQDR